MADQSKHLIDQCSDNSGAKTRPLMLSEVEAAAQEFCKKILSVFQDNMPAGITEQPQNQESMMEQEPDVNQDSSHSTLTTINTPETQRTGNSGAKSQPLLSEVEAAAQEFCKKILSVFQDNMPASIIEQPQNQESMLEQELDVNHDNSDSTPTTISTLETQQPMFSEAEVAAQEYLKGRKHVYYLPLYLAANKGDWKSAKIFIECDPNASTARITKESLTTLMVAARARQWKFAQKLLKDLPSKSLEAVDIGGRTALHYVAYGGSLETAKALIRKNSALLQISDNQGRVPLCSNISNKQLLWYLILVTRDEHPCFPFTGSLSGLLVRSLIGSGYYDITLYLVRKYPELAFKKYMGRHLLASLSDQYSDFLSGSNLTFWERWIYKLIHIQVADEPPHSVLLNMEDFLANAQDFQDKAVSVQPSSILSRA